MCNSGLCRLNGQIGIKRRLRRDRRVDIETIDGWILWRGDLLDLGRAIGIDGGGVKILSTGIINHSGLAQPLSRVGHIGWGRCRGSSCWPGDLRLAACRSHHRKDQAQANGDQRRSRPSRIGVHPDDITKVPLVTSLMAEANSFIGSQPQNLLGFASRPPEGPVRPHQQPYSRAVTSVGASPRAPIPLTAEAASPLGAI